MVFKIFFLFFTISVNAKVMCGEVRQDSDTGKEFRVGDVSPQTYVKLNDDFYKKHGSLEKYLHLRCREYSCMRASRWTEKLFISNRGYLDANIPSTLTFFNCTNSRLPRFTLGPLTQAGRLKSSYKELTNSGVLGAFSPLGQRSKRRSLEVPQDTDTGSLN